MEADVCGRSSTLALFGSLAGEGLGGVVPHNPPLWAYLELWWLGFRIIAPQAMWDLWSRSGNAILTTQVPLLPQDCSASLALGV